MSGYVNITIPKRSNLVCATTDSSIELADTHGDIDVKTSHGSIVCKNITFTDLKARSEGGAMTMAFSRVTPPEINADAQANGGEIRFEVPFEFTGQVEFEATSGCIHNELPVVGHVDKRRITGTVGRGKASCD